MVFGITLIALGVFNLIYGWKARDRFGIVRGVVIPVLLLPGFVALGIHLIQN